MKVTRAIAARGGAVERPGSDDESQSRPRRKLTQWEIDRRAQRRSDGEFVEALREVLGLVPLAGDTRARGSRRRHARERRQGRADGTP